MIVRDAEVYSER